MRREDELCFSPDEMRHDQTEIELEAERCTRCHGVLEETDRIFVFRSGWMHDDCVRRLLEGEGQC